MEVLGRDGAAEAYRVAHDGIVGLLPEALIADHSLTGGHGHATAYDWIARHAHEIETTLKTLRDGGRPDAPFDRMALVEE